MLSRLELVPTCLDGVNLTVCMAISQPASVEQSPDSGVTRGLCFSSQDFTTLLLLRNFVCVLLIGYGFIVFGYIRDVSKYKNMIQNGQISASTDYWKHTG